MKDKFNETRATKTSTSEKTLKKKVDLSFQTHERWWEEIKN